MPQKPGPRPRSAWGGRSLPLRAEGRLGSLCFTVTMRRCQMTLCFCFCSCFFFSYESSHQFLEGSLSSREPNHLSLRVGWVSHPGHKGWRNPRLPLGFCFALFCFKVFDFGKLFRARLETLRQSDPLRCQDAFYSSLKQGSSLFFVPIPPGRLETGASVLEEPV